MQFKSLWIKASAKCINVNANVTKCTKVNIKRACFTYMLRCVFEPVQQHVLSSRLSDRRLLSQCCHSLWISCPYFSPLSPSVRHPEKQHNTLTVCWGHKPRPPAQAMFGESPHRLAEMSCAKITKHTGSQPND